MSTSLKRPDHEITRETIEEIMKAAHRERAEAISQLFGFGFSAVKDAVRGTFKHRATPLRTVTTDGASCG